jgi:predicted transport protein
LHEAVLSQIRAFGDFEEAPKKSYVSLRRKKQFAMVGPATKDSVEIGLNAKDLPAHARLKLQPTGSMCNATTRITSAAEVDAQLQGWLRRAYDAAG